jgi:hypothetical protein
MALSWPRDGDRRSLHCHHSSIITALRLLHYQHHCTVITQLSLHSYHSKGITTLSSLHSHRYKHVPALMQLRCLRMTLPSGDVDWKLGAGILCHKARGLSDDHDGQIRMASADSVAGQMIQHSGQMPTLCRTFRIFIHNIRLWNHRLRVSWCMLYACMKGTFIVIVVVVIEFPVQFIWICRTIRLRSQMCAQESANTQ